MEHRFGAAPAWTLGIEEELVLVDARTFEAAPAFTRVFGEGREPFKPEVFECLVELTTGVLGLDEVLSELERLRAQLASVVEPHGIRIHSAGTHALAVGEGQPVVPVERYRRLVEQIGPPIYRQLVCGLHVHVSIPDPDACLHAFEGVLPWLPVLLAVSASSPFAEGKDTGRRSERAVRLLDMPTGGTPPVLGDWDDWEAATSGDATRRHWDAWPRPEYGTLEVRVMDLQTDVRRSAGLAAIVQALVRAVPDDVAGPYDRELYTRRRAAAAVEPPDPAEVEALAGIVLPVLDGEPATWAEGVLAGSAEAERQLEVAAAGGIAAVPPDVAGRTVASP